VTPLPIGVDVEDVVLFFRPVEDREYGMSGDFDVVAIEMPLKFE
jgi:hypothetical protein